MKNLKMFEYWLPSQKAGENYMKFVTEMMINAPYEENKTLLEIYLQPGGKNKVRKLTAEAINQNQFMKLLERISSVRLDCRLSMCYTLSGGLLNIFNEDVDEKYDEVWHQISGSSNISNSAELWNTTPNNLFSMLTPEQVWACPGKEEFRLLDIFLDSLTKQFDGRGFEYDGEMITQSISILRGWLCTKGKDGEKPIDIIKGERLENLRKNKNMLFRKNQ